MLCLRRDRVGDLLPSITDIDAVEPGKRIEAGAAVGIGDVDAVAADDHSPSRLTTGMCAHVGGGVEEVIAVPGGQWGACVGHV